MESRLLVAWLLLTTVLPEYRVKLFSDFFKPSKYLPPDYTSSTTIDQTIQLILILFIYISEHYDKIRFVQGNATKSTLHQETCIVNGIKRSWSELPVAPSYIDSLWGVGALIWRHKEIWNWFSTNDAKITSRVKMKQSRSQWNCRRAMQRLKQVAKQQLRSYLVETEK